MATLANLARMISVTTGTGSVVLTSAATSYLTFEDAGIVDGQTLSYAMLWNNQREVGRGVYTAATNTLTRNVLTSTNGNAAVNILGQSEWIVTALAEDFLDIAASISNTPAQTTFLVSGGQVVWISALTFRVSAAIYYIAGIQYQSAEQTVTLDAAEASDRIDVIAVNSSAAVVGIKGTAAATPSEPDVDPATQLKLAIVTIPALAAQPTVTNTTLYADDAGGPTEWNWTTSGSGWTLNSAVDPHSGTTDIDGTSTAANSYAQGQIPSGSVTPSTLNLLVLYIKSKQNWANNRGLQITLRSTGVLVGQAVSINRSGSFGFDASNTSTYQQVAIPLQQFAIPAGSTINQIRIADFGGAINFRLDDIIFQAGGSSPSPTNFAPLAASYITISADATLTNERVLTAGTALGIADGGAGSTITISVTDAELTAIAGLTSAADRVPYFTGSGTAALGNFTSFGRSLVASADASAGRTVLALGNVSTINLNGNGSTVLLGNGTFGTAGVSTTLTSAHILVGNATNIATDVAVSGDISITNAGVTAIGSNKVLTAMVADGNVTYAKIQDVSATSRALGRNSSGSGDVEEVTMSQILDWVGSAAQGDILYRNAASWVRLGAGTANTVLTTGGAGANPSWRTSSGGGGTTGTASGDLAAAILADTPTAYWKCDDSATPIVDYSGNGYNLTVNGTPTLQYTYLLPNDTLKFMRTKGTTDGAALDTKLGTSPPITGDWTATAVVLAEVTTASTVFNLGLSSSELEVNNNQINCGWQNSGALFTNWESGAGTDNVVNAPYATGGASALGVVQILHWVKDGTAKTVTFYHNGRQIGAAVSFTNNPTGGTGASVQASIGDPNGSTTRNMVIGHVAIFVGSKLSAARIKAHADAAQLGYA